ncbi:MAG: protein kinase [Acidobacteria bacterium]|nr:protein kinase [Acidobacteriota bacterium]
MIDRTILHYKILEKLGGGGMGVVFKAQDLELGRLVALKFLPPAFAEDEEAKRRFIREAKAASTLDHANICTIHEVEESEAGELFIVMAYYRGRTLRARIDEGPLPVADAVGIAIDVAHGLSAAHERSVVHRDIKPENIFLTDDGGLKILDFGLAKLGGGSISKPGTVLGTAAYMAPEQAVGGEVDERADVWALGAMLYEMLTGARPFAGEHDAVVMYSVLNTEPRPLAAAREDVPERLRTIVDTALEKNPDDRHADVDSMLVELIELRAETQWTKPPAGAGSSSVASAAGSRRHRRFAVAAVVVAPMLVAGWLTYHGGAPGPESPSATAAPVVQRTYGSVAVLPLTNLGGDPEDEYFSDGVTEDIITQLAKIGAFKVISRTSTMRYKGTETPLPQIADALGVETILEGSVRRAGDRVRITAQLIDAETDEHLWAESFDGDLGDALGFQSVVALRVAAALKAELSGVEQARVNERGAVSAEAYDHFIRGLHHRDRRTPEDSRLAREHFQQAAAVDPTYADAHGGVASSYAFLARFGVLSPAEAIPKAVEAARKALALDPDQVDAQLVLAAVQGLIGKDWTAAERIYRRVLEVAPISPAAHTQYAMNLLLPLGRFDEALPELRAALELDPLSELRNGDLAITLFYARRYDEALRQLDSTLALYPNSFRTREFVGRVYIATGRLEEAIETLRDAVPLSPGSTEALAWLGFAYGLHGDRDQAQACLNELERHPAQERHKHLAKAVMHAGLGNTDLAFAALESAYVEREPLLAFLRVSPALDSLRSDPRFHSLLERMNLSP